MTKKQYSTPKVSVGTVKKSIAAMASQWLLRKAAHRLAGSGHLGALRIQRNTVRSERSKPSIFNSPWMRGAPHVEFSATIRKISSRNSLLMHFLPERTRRRESHVQYSLNPARCQRTTVSGWTRINACLHSGQSRRKITQNSLSEVETSGRRLRCFKTTSCSRRAKFSSNRSLRERKRRIKRTAKDLSRQSMTSVSYGQTRTRADLPTLDFSADRYFGEPQDS